MRRGWHYDSYRHSLAARGVSTRRLALARGISVQPDKYKRWRKLVNMSPSEIKLFMDKYERCRPESNGSIKGGY
jgi:hypothetical protein